jgi:hypothetical protein
VKLIDLGIARPAGTREAAPPPPPTSGSGSFHTLSLTPGFAAPNADSRRAHHRRRRPFLGVG